MRGAAILLLTVGVLTSCGGPAQPPPELEGRIVEIVDGGSGIEAFIVEAGDERFRFVIDRKRDYGFDPAHLREHMEQDLPVLVRSQVNGDEAVATAIEDA